MLYVKTILHFYYYYYWSTRATNLFFVLGFADQLGISRQTVISIEANKDSPSLILAFQIAQLFNKGINDVFQYVPEGVIFSD